MLNLLINYFQTVLLGFFEEEMFYNNPLDEILSYSLSLVFVLFLIIYLMVVSLKYKKISKNLNQENPNLSGIPFVGPLVVEFKSSKNSIYLSFVFLFALICGFFVDLSFNHISLEGGAFTCSGVFCNLEIFVGLFVLFSLASFAVITIWHWKMFKSLGRSGAWSLILFFSLSLMTFIFSLENISSFPIVGLFYFSSEAMKLSIFLLSVLAVSLVLLLVHFVIVSVSSKSTGEKK